jgi:hypothetical protein
MALSPVGTVNNMISLNGLGASAGRSANQGQGTGQGTNAFAGAAVNNAQAQNAALFQIPIAGNATSAGIGSASAGTNIVAGSLAGNSLGRPAVTTLTIPTLNIPGIAPGTPTQTPLTFAAFPPPTGPGFALVGTGFVLPQPNLNSSAQQFVAPQTSLLSVPTFNLEPTAPEEEEEPLTLQPLPDFNLSNAATERSLVLPGLPSLPSFDLNPINTLSIADIPVISLPEPLLDTNTEAANLDTDTAAANLDTDTEAAGLIDGTADAEDTEETSTEEAEAEEARPDPLRLNNAAANFAIRPIRFLDDRVLSPTENSGDASNTGTQNAVNVEGTSVGNEINVTA